MRPFLLALSLVFFLAGGHAAAQEDLPYTLERFTLPGPVAGVLARVDLRDTRVQVQVALADEHDPDGDGPCTGQLDTVSSAARRHGYALALNASFFAAPVVHHYRGREYRYVVGSCGIPSGWHFSNGRQLTAPAKEGLRATLVVHADGHVSLHAGLQALPADTRYAVSGSDMLLEAGRVLPAAGGARHPRSAAALADDGKTLLLLAVDGRQEHSRGATLEELAQLLRGFGAQAAINLDGGGSTTLVVRDPAVGVYAVANRPSDQSTQKLPVQNERPVADLIGILLQAK